MTVAGAAMGGTERAAGAPAGLAVARVGDAHGDVAADGADQPLQIAVAGLARVVEDDLLQRGVRDAKLL